MFLQIWKSYLAIFIVVKKNSRELNSAKMHFPPNLETHLEYMVIYHVDKLRMG